MCVWRRNQTGARPDGRRLFLVKYGRIPVVFLGRRRIGLRLRCFILDSGLRACGFLFLEPVSVQGPRVRAGFEPSGALFRALCRCMCCARVSWRRWTALDFRTSAASAPFFEKQKQMMTWMFCRALHCSVASVRPYSDVVG